MMDLSTFRSIYPEFVSVADPQVTAQLAYASQSIDSTIFGADYDRSVGLLTAHFLSASPGAQQARLDPSAAQKAGTNTTYGALYLSIRDRVTACLRIF